MQSVILGTAQWGLDYGVTNTAGRLSDQAVRDLASAAWEAGIRMLDTAPAYGDAEARIGGLAPQFAVQTKVPIAEATASSVAASVSASLARLGRESVAAVLVHDWSVADGQTQASAAAALEALRDEGVIAAVGVSGYGREDIASALAAFERLDVVQVPVSVLDQRMAGSRELAEVRSRGGRVQARSVFLQGAALATAEHPRLGDHPDVVRLRSAGRPLELCLGYVASLEWVDEVVLAATTAVELEEIMAGLAEPVRRDDWATLASADPQLVDPRMWTAPTRRGEQ